MLLADLPTIAVNTKPLSVIVPTLNEAECIEELVQRIASSLKDYEYEIIFIDDHSTDNTPHIINKLSTLYPIRLYEKEGKPGKAYSLLQGFKLTRYDTIAMIDADLQYPPEALPEMAKIIQNNEADLVVANRVHTNMGFVRKFLSNGYKLVFGKLIWKLPVDVQSGQKVFKKEIVERDDYRPDSGWTFDLEFLLKARSGGYRLAGYDIKFVGRTKGQTKIDIISTIFHCGFSAIRLRFHPPHFMNFHTSQNEAIGHGFHFRGNPYVTYTTLTRDDIAAERTFPLQRTVFAAFLITLAYAFFTDWFATVVILISIATVFYFLDLLFNMYLILRSFYRNVEIRVAKSTIKARSEWPIYTIFCPLYKESAVLPQFIEAMRNLEYPKDKLEVMLLLEADDQETIDAAKAMKLPSYFKIMVVPHAMPKTKPKACNYGLVNATGQYAVIYDAEDIPDPLQLKKAVIAFSKVPKNIGCIQAKLNYYNWDQNILTRLFTLEYSLWFNLVLSGLQGIYAPIPLGGTSNHFRVSDLKAFAGWDPFNVTEDADLGMRLAKKGYQTAILDSYTMEEANSELGNWIKQRSRWIKGYMQTYLVHMRKPRKHYRQNLSRMLFMQLVIGGKIVSMLINPFFWLITAAYLLVPASREFIQSLFLTPVFYMGLFSLVVGNFLYLYYYMLGGIKQGKPELNLYALFIPFYWLMMSFAAFYALRDLIIRPHHWHKTKHGLHLKKPQASDVEDLKAEEVAI